MIFKNLTQEITEQMLLDLARDQQQKEVSKNTSRYVELIGDDVFNASYRETYWPKSKSDNPQEYEERKRIWVPWADMISRRLASVCLSGKVERFFEPIDDADQAMADQANELLQRQTRHVAGND